MNAQFRGTDWLTLELAIEVIGDMIGYYSQSLHSAIERRSNAESVAKIEMELSKLCKERQKCYDSNSNQEVLIKAFAVYAPKLKEISRNSTFIC